MSPNKIEWLKDLNCPTFLEVTSCNEIRQADGFFGSGDIQNYQLLIAEIFPSLPLPTILIIHFQHSKK